MESQSQFIFRRETKRKSEKCNFNTPEIRLRTKTGYIRRAGSFSACLKFREVPAVMLVCLSDYVRPSSSQRSVFNWKQWYSLSLGILALSAERSSWLTPNSSNCRQHSAPVYISWSKTGRPCSSWVILCSRSYQVNGDTQTERMQTQ